MAKAKDNTTPLSKHKRQGKKFIPPFDFISKAGRRSWVNEVLPEFLWAALLITNLPRREALGLFRKVVDKMVEFAVGKTGKEIKFNPTHTGLSFLPLEQLNQVLNILCSKPEYRKILSPLLFYKDLPQYKVWKTHVNQEPGRESWKIIQHGVVKTLFHQSQEATDCRWIIVYFDIVARVISVPLPDIVKEIKEYPNFGDMRKVRPTIHSMEMAGFALSDLSRDWSPHFWGTSLRLTGCGGIKERSTQDTQFLKELKTNLNEEFRDIFIRFSATLTTTEINPKHDAVFGIVLYSWRITAEIILGINNKMVLGSLGLRALAECLISLSYLIKEDKNDLWSSYREYGSGQAKLAYLKFEEIGDIPAYFDIETIKMIANEDAWVEFVPVNVGNWGEQDLRKISIQSGTKDIYDKYYSWTSNYSHGTWGAVRETVFQTCLNPLHRLHRIPFTHEKLFKDQKEDALLLFGKITDLLDRAYPRKTKESVSK